MPQTHPAQSSPEGHAVDTAVCPRFSRSDYLLRPSVSAAIAQSTLTATANAAGRALLTDKIRNSTALPILRRM